MSGAMSHPKSTAMPSDPNPPQSSAQAAGENRAADKQPLTPEAERALAEATARRAERARQEADTQADQPKEVGGRGGPEPTRYGDWEINGIIADF